jgi:hypothetical protein
MYQIDKLEAFLPLGNQNEHGVTQVAFDIAAWQLPHPVGAAMICAHPGAADGLWMTYTRGRDTLIYPINPDDLALEGSTLTWTVQESVTALGGMGTVVIHCTEGAVERRAAMTHVIVAEGHAAAGEAPEPIADWIREANAALAAIEGISFAINNGNLEVTI